MEAREWLAVAMFVSFIALIFTGFPVAWVLGGLAIFFTAAGIIAERDLGIHLVLVGSNDRLIEQKDADGNDTGCLINNDAFTTLAQNQQWIDEILGRSVRGA